MCLCEQLNEELKQNLKETMTKKYLQSGYDQVTQAVDKLQQEVCVRTVGQGCSHPQTELKCSPLSSQFKCCGSNGSSDWSESVYIRSGAEGRLVPDSCCKSPSQLCGLRDHPSNIYKVEVRAVEGVGVVKP